MLVSTEQSGKLLDRESLKLSPGDIKAFSCCQRVTPEWLLRFGYSMITLAFCLWTVSWIFVTCLNLAAARQVTSEQLADFGLLKLFPRSFASDVSSFEMF